MGLFDWIWKRPNIKVARQNDGYFKTLTAYQPHFTTWNGQLYENELVRASIDARARHVSKLKVEIQGAAKPTLQTKIRLKPNNWQTWSQFLYRTSTILDMHNTVVIVPVLDEVMNPVGYASLLPERCDIVEQDGVPFLRYRFENGQVAANYLAECAILTKFQYKSDFFGETNRALDPTMQLAHINAEGIKEAVKNGATYRFMARVQNFTFAEDLTEERKRFNEANLKSDDENTGILLFPNTYSDIRQINNQAYTVPKEELEEIRRGVYDYFGVNEEILQNKAYGDAWAAFYEGAIEPFAIQFSETMSQAAFSDLERAHGALIMATSNRLQYMTTQEKLNVSTDLSDRGILSRNEVREIWNLPPIEGGNEYIIRGEYYNAAEKITPAEGENNGDQE